MLTDLKSKWSKGKRRRRRIRKRRTTVQVVGKMLKYAFVLVSLWCLLAVMIDKASAQSTPDPLSSKTVIGIDLGTKYSVVAVTRDGQTTIIPNEHGNRITPSVVGFHPALSERFVGDSAMNQMSSNPSNTIFDAKRFIGRHFSDLTVKNDMKYAPYKVVQSATDQPMFSVRYKNEDKLFSAEEISAMVLRKMKQTAENYLGLCAILSCFYTSFNSVFTHHPTNNISQKYAHIIFIGYEVHDAVITVPSQFDDGQRQATKDAGKIAGLNVVRIVSEPTAAAIAYGLDREMLSTEEKNILVFDLGGGTFDVSLLTLDEGVFEVIGNGGDTHLGGEDFDNNVLKYFVKMFKRKNKGIDLSKNGKAISRLKQEIEKAKIALSSTNQVKIEIENIYTSKKSADSLSLDFSETLTRARFEELNHKLFKKTIKTIEQVLKDTGFSKQDIDEIIMVGGSTRIPKIQEMVRKLFNGKSLNRGINPDEAVAYGASIQAAVIGGHFGDTQHIVIDATPLSLGIETVGDIFAKVIGKNTAFPTKKSQIFSTAEDGQTSVMIKVFQGERAVCSGNRKIGEFMLDGIDANLKRGQAQIEVTFAIDANGILDVSAKEKGKNSDGSKITINRDTYNLSEEEIAEMMELQKIFQEEDEQLLTVIKAKNALESKVYAVRNMLTDESEDHGYGISEEDTHTLSNLCEETMEWLEEASTQEISELELQDIEQMQADFDDISKPILQSYNIQQSQSYGAQSSANDDDEDTAL